MTRFKQTGQIVLVILALFWLPNCDGPAEPVTDDPEIIEPLAVVNVSPQNGSEDVFIDRTITVALNNDLVPEPS